MINIITIFGCKLIFRIFCFCQISLWLKSEPNRLISQWFSDACLHYEHLACSVVIWDPHNTNWTYTYMYIFVYNCIFSSTHVKEHFSKQIKSGFLTFFLNMGKYIKRFVNAAIVSLPKCSSIPNSKFRSPCWVSRPSASHSYRWGIQPR